MGEFPEKLVKDNKKYNFVKQINRKLALYVTDKGIKECFDRFDCGLVPVRFAGRYPYEMRGKK